MRCDGTFFLKGNRMKIPALLTVAVLACSAAFAAQNSTDSDRTAGNPSAAAASGKQSDGKASKAGTRTKQALQRAGQKVRETGSRIANAGRKATRRDDQAADTRNMGAAGSESARRARMDEAYDNWKSGRK